MLDEGDLDHALRLRLADPAGEAHRQLPVVRLGGAPMGAVDALGDLGGGGRAAPHPQERAGRIEEARGDPGEGAAGGLRGEDDRDRHAVLRRPGVQRRRILRLEGHAHHGQLGPQGRERQEAREPGVGGAGGHGDHQRRHPDPPDRTQPAAGRQHRHVDGRARPARV